MDIKTLLKKFSSFSQLDETADKLQYVGSRIHWKGLIGSSKSILSGLLAKQVPGHHLFILEDKEKAAYFLNDLEGLFPGQALFYPASYRTPYQLEETDNANVVARAEVLEKVNKGTNSWIVTYPKALFEKVPTKVVLTENTFKIENGKEYSIDFITEVLLEYGFEIEDFVYEPGQFSVRGGIVDVFSFSNDHPFRIEFFGDEVDSIRTFDPVSQLSINQHEFFQVIPNIQDEKIQKINGSILQFIGEQSTIWTSSSNVTAKTIELEYEKATKIYTDLPETGVTRTPPNEMFFHPSEWKTQIQEFSTIEFGPDYASKADLTCQFSFNPQPAFNKNFELLREDLIARKKVGFDNLIFSNQPKQIERLYDIFADIGGEVEFSPQNFALQEGFISSDAKIVLYTDHQIFERYHRFKLKEGFRQAKQAITLKEVYNLQKGDFVTHIDHGVGQFSGLQTIDVNGKAQEAIRLIYKDNDVLYVSIHSLHRISKFTGKDGTVPKMNKLGTQAWATLKQKTKKKIKEIAYDLIQLYAKRKSQVGFAFAPDTYLQNELEASFTASVAFN